SSGAIIGDVADNGALVLNRGDAVTFEGVISGVGSLVQAGPGTLTLTAANTYLGGTRVDGGRLLVDGSILGDVAVAGGARLGGVGDVGGIVTIADGAHLAPGAS